MQTELEEVLWEASEMENKAGIEKKAQVGEKYVVYVVALV